MNKLEVSDLIEQIPQFLTPDEFLVALATKAAEFEREACAKVCDEVDVEANKKFKASGKSNPYEQGVSDGANACAVTIRARGEK